MQFAVNDVLWSPCSYESRRSGYAIDTRVRCAAARREGEHCDARLDSEQGGRVRRSRDGDIGQLLRCRFDDDSTVGEQKQSAMTVFARWGHHDEEAGNCLRARRWADAVQHRLDRLCRCVCGPSNEPVGLTGGDHQR